MNDSPIDCLYLIFVCCRSRSALFNGLSQTIACCTQYTSSTPASDPLPPGSRLVDEVDTEEMQDETADDVIGKGPAMKELVLRL